MSLVLVLSGHGRYADPWHPFEQTSDAVAALLSGQGHRVEVRTTVPSAYQGLDGFDLIVVNAGGGDPRVATAPEPAWDAAHAELDRWLGAGGRLIGLHTAANAFPDWAAWPGHLGGRWVRGLSGHPRRSVAVFEAVGSDDVHAGLPELAFDDHPRRCVVAYDERYSDLELAECSIPLLAHESDGKRHVMAWRTKRAIYDAMGHDARSYESASRRRFFTNCVTSLLAT